MTKSRVSVAVVGCGRWGTNLVRNFAQLGALARICDPDPVALETNAVEGVVAGSDFDAVLEDQTVQGVVIAGPAGTHADLALKALAAGKDVFVEKPLALHYDEGVRLERAAEAADRVLMVGHLLAYHPAIVRLQELVRAGELGHVRYLYSNRLNLGTVRSEENILWSFAPHDISVLCSLAEADPVRVNAVGGAYLQHGIADITVTNLVFPAEVRAHIFVSWLHPYKEQRLVVIGEEKMAVFEERPGGAELRLFDKGIEWEGGKPIPRESAEIRIDFDRGEPLKFECLHFLECMQTRNRPKTDSVDGLRVLRILEAGQRSLEGNGIPVDITEIGSVVPR